mmetsp:Transcript_14784/g.24217  ORF Transcript_14784/g.24217 Transcript_14784/m.24217 type:complete len:389 (+) Transcript_14784:603-1769(+)
MNRVVISRRAGLWRQSPRSSHVGARRVARAPLPPLLAALATVDNAAAVVSWGARDDGHRAPSPMRRGFAASATNAVGAGGYTSPDPDSPSSTADNVADGDGDEEEQEQERIRAQQRDRAREDADAAHGVTQRLLAAAVKHAAGGSGWTDASLRAAASDLGYSPAVLGQLPRGVGSLVEHFVEECDSRLSVMVSSRHDELADMSGTQRLATVMHWRLAMLEPVIEGWAAAVAIQAAPENIPSTLRQRAMLSDEMCGASGPGFGLAHISLPGGASASGGVDMAVAGWYSDRTAVAALYSTCELYMLTDTSQNFADTRAFVTRRVGELSEAGKTFEEVGGFAAMAAKGLPAMPGAGLSFPTMPAAGKEALEGLFSKVASAVLSGGLKGPKP